MQDIFKNKPKMDCIYINNLKVRAKIGVHKWEQAIQQTLTLDLEIPTDISKCADNIADTIDYDKLCTMLTEYIESNSFALIETVANNVAELIKDKFAVDGITVSVNKPNAVANAGNIGVKITR